MNLPASIENFLKEIQDDLQSYESSDVIACATKVYQHLEKSIINSDNQTMAGALAARRTMVQGLISQYSA